MSNCRVDLNLSPPHTTGSGVGSGAGAGPGHNTRRQADAQASSRFQRALDADAADATGAKAKGPTDATASSLFALFGAARGPLAAPAAAPAERAAPAVNDIDHQIASTVERLLVSDDEHGRRQVRLELIDDVLPGVRIEIQHSQGRLQVDFICTREDSRLRLNRAAPEQAQILADRLCSPVLLRVRTDDEEDLCLFEAAAQP